MPGMVEMKQVRAKAEDKAAALWYRESMCLARRWEVAQSIFIE